MTARRNIPYTLELAARLSSQMALSPKGPRPHDNNSIGATQVHTANGISIGSSVSAGLMVVTDRQTHRPRYMCSNRPHLRTAHQQGLWL